MSATIDPAKRAATLPPADHQGPVTLVNSFVVPAERDGAFEQIWTRTSAYFRGQPGFIGLRLHRALSPDATYRYVNVAVWRSSNEFGRAHEADEFRQLVSDPAWREFPSSPALYEVAASYDAVGSSPNASKCPSGSARTKS
ncbi:antibiotic biosynthesis monooxygenase family protein [Jatrophihabitans sp. DSM 45814]